jgi:hypothetical protein
MTKINQSFENEYFVSFFFFDFVAVETYLDPDTMTSRHPIGMIWQIVCYGTPLNSLTTCFY